MKLANRLSRVKPSATLAVNAKALELKNRGVDVISLAVGEPDFPTPPHIAEAAKKAIDEHFTRYTAVAGIPEIRAGICGYYQKVHGVSAKNENVIIGNGGKQCLYNLLLCLLNEGDDVLIPVPYWTSYPDMAALVGANPVFVPSSAENGYRISLGALDASLTPKTKLLLLNSPSNPSGVAIRKKNWIPSSAGRWKKIYSSSPTKFTSSLCMMKNINRAQANFGSNIRIRLQFSTRFPKASP